MPKNKKRILHLITGLEIGGAEMMLLKTLPRLQNDFDNRVCCIRGRGPIGDKLQAKGIPVYYLDLKNCLDIRIVWKFRKIIKDFQPEILVTYLIHADLFGRVFGRLFGVKKIVCSVRVKLIQAKYLPLLVLDGLTSFLVTRYHFNSKIVAEMYQKYFFLPKRKITIIYNGIEIKKYNIQADIRQKKLALKIPLDKIIIGCVAKLRKQKGHKYLISAFAEVLKNNPDVFLLIIGEGEERSNIENQIKKTKLINNIVLLGDRSDIPELLQIIDIFILPTLFEGMSNALLEAMTAGLPIITTDIPENREIIENNKEGMLVPPKKFLALEKAMIRLINNPDLRFFLGENAKRKIEENFDIEKVSQKIIYFMTDL